MAGELQHALAAMVGVDRRDSWAVSPPIPAQTPLAVSPIEAVIHLHIEGQTGGAVIGSAATRAPAHALGRHQSDPELRHDALARAADLAERPRPVGDPGDAQ